MASATKRAFMCQYNCVREGLRTGPRTLLQPPSNPSQQTTEHDMLPVSAAVTRRLRTSPDIGADIITGLNRSARWEELCSPYSSPADRVRQRVGEFASCTMRIPHDIQYS